MTTFKDIEDAISKKKPLKPSDGFWRKFDRELAGKLDAVDNRSQSRAYGLADIFSVFLQPKPALVTAILVIMINLAIFSFAQRGIYLTSVALISNDDLAGELVLADELSFGENIVDFSGS